MSENETLTVSAMLLRLVVAAAVGAAIGYERRMHHKAIGIAGMVLIAVGSATYMLLAKHLTVTDPSAAVVNRYRPAAKYSRLVHRTENWSGWTPGPGAPVDQTKSTCGSSRTSAGVPDSVWLLKYSPRNGADGA